MIVRITAQKHRPIPLRKRPHQHHDAQKACEGPCADLSGAGGAHQAPRNRVDRRHVRVALSATTIAAILRRMQPRRQRYPGSLLLSDWNVSSIVGSNGHAMPFVLACDASSSYLHSATYPASTGASSGAEEGERERTGGAQIAMVERLTCSTCWCPVAARLAALSAAAERSTTSAAVRMAGPSDRSRHSAQCCAFERVENGLRNGALMPSANTLNTGLLCVLADSCTMSIYSRICGAAFAP